MVMTQATTMLVVTFQRTAETRRAAPTPTMAPVIVCVVETGTPSAVARNRVMAPPRLGAKAAHRGKVGDLRSHRANDAPAAEKRSQRHRRLAGEHDPERH